MLFTRLKGIFISLSCALALTACVGNQSGEAPSIYVLNLSISPASVDLVPNETTTFSATGGDGVYSYSIFSGSGSILSTTGSYTAGTSAGTAVVRVVDGKGQYADAIITVHDALQISPTSYFMGINSNHTFSASGGVGGRTFSVASGVGSINSVTGVYSSGSSGGSAVVRVTDGMGHTADSSVTVTASLGISPSSGTISINSSTSFSAAGGTSPYTFSVVSGGGSINSSNGSYTAPSSSGTVVVRVTDASSNTADATMNVVNAAPVLSSISSQSTSEDVALPVNFTITDIDSTLTCNGSVSASSTNVALVPASGIAFSGTAPNCVITLTPSSQQSGSAQINLSVTDGENVTNGSFTLTVGAVNDTPIISAISSQAASEDGSVAVNFTISDVEDTLTCASSMSFSSSDSNIVGTGDVVFTGTAPNCTGTITPKADQNGSINVTFRVSDSAPLHADRTFALNISSINDAPIVSSISNQTVKSDESIVVNYTITDVDHSLNCSSSVGVVSSNTSVLPNANITKGGSSPNCTLTITPSLNVAGNSNVTVTVTDGASATDDSVFDVAVVNVTSVAVSPTSFNLGVNGTRQLSALAYYSNSTSTYVTTSSLASWSSSNAAVASVNNTSSKGLVTGVASGSATVALSYKGVSSTSATASVITATSLSVSLGSVSGGIGSQSAVTATAQDGSTSFDVTYTGSWSSSNNSVATVSNGVISFVSAGSATVTVSYAGLTADVLVTVNPKSLVSIAVTASGTASVQVNGTKNLVATATYSDSSTENVTYSVTWASANESVLTISNSSPYNGQTTGVAAGTSNVTATIGAVSGNLLMTVNGVTLSSIAILPNDALVSSGANYSLSAIGTYSDASSADITHLVTWSSSNTLAATISNAAETKGVATTPSFTGYRTTTIAATLGAVTGTTPFGVNGASISSMLVTPSVTITPSSTYSMKSYANLSDGGVIDLTQFSVWSSTSTSNVTVSNSLGFKGLVSGIANGSSSIKAAFGSASGTRTVNVAASSTLSEIGIGLTGTYYTWSGGAPPASPFLLANKKGQRYDARVNFAWASGNAPMGVGEQFSVRWTGYYKATSANNYFCTYSDDGVRLWINGTQVVNNWTEHSPTWNCTGNIALTVGTKYAVIMEYYENGGGSEAHLTRSSTSAADAQNVSTRAIPQADLYPE